MPRPCRAALIHTCHAAPLSSSDSDVSFVKVRMVAGNIRTASPTVCYSTLLITNFVELRVVAGRSRTRPGRPHAVSVWPKPITHAMPCPCRAVPWPWEFDFKTVWSWYGMGAACETNTTSLCKSNGKDTSKPLAARHGHGMRTAWYVWIRL
jgi:hypothetical protein